MGYYSIHRREKGKNFKRLDRKEWILSKEQVKDIVIVSQYDWEKAQEIRELKKARLEEKKRKRMLYMKNNIRHHLIREENFHYWELRIVVIVVSV